jgi:addiction module HigA family antidote
MAKARRLRNIHPGEVLVEEFLKPLEISRYQLAKDIRVPLTRISEICRGRRAITAGTALRLARFFQTSPKFWLGLQEDFDLEEEVRSSPRELAKIRPHAGLEAAAARPAANGRR